MATILISRCPSGDFDCMTASNMLEQVLPVNLRLYIDRYQSLFEALKLPFKIFELYLNNFTRKHLEICF